MDEYQKYLNKVLRFLSYRSRSKKEVRDFLHKKQTPSDIVTEIMRFLEEKRFVDDNEFARWWIDQSLRVRHKSKRVIEMELKQKGVPYEIIEQAISHFTFSPFETSEGVNDGETARRLVEKKIGRYRHLAKQELYQKLGGFLARKGFDWETIKKAIDNELHKDE